MTDTEIQQLVDKYRHGIFYMTEAGFEHPDDIADTIVQRVLPAGYPSNELYAPFEAVCREISAQKQQREATWPKVTDCDRLDAASSGLHSASTIFRQHLETSAEAAIPWTEEQVRRERTSGQYVDAYAYYFSHDTWQAIAGHDLVVRFGSIWHEERESVRVAETVVRVMEDHGLHATWDGNTQGVISVEITWQRRQPPLSRQQIRAQRDIGFRSW